MKVAALLLCIAGVVLGTPVQESGWRIVGGSTAADGQFPYQIFFRTNGRFSCGGSILDETTILTAAHCVLNGPNAMTVVTGSNKLDQGGDEYEVSKIIVYPDYNPQLHQKDLAIVKLATPIVYNEKVQPIKLRQSYIAGEQSVTLSGWGAMKLWGPTPNDLQWIKLKTITWEQCKQWVIANPILDSQLCTLNGYGQGACNGDSGGPLVDENGEQVGIVSWGIPCAQGIPDMFTRCYSFLDWIEENRK